MTTPNTARLLTLPLLLLLAGLTPAGAQIVISEIQYHPVEEPAFNTDGTPFLDLTDDVHEFVEIHNAGATTLDLSGWKLTGGIDFTIPAGATIAAGSYRVIAKTPARIATVYGIPQATILGPFTGTLSNNGDTIRLRDAGGATVDEVTYSAGFPWAVSADSLGAGLEWTGIDMMTYQYRGRSLQRVSVAAASNDPANWVATPLNLGPTPGRKDASETSLAVPRPVVLAYNVTQDTDEAPIIRNNQAARLTCTFSSTVSLSNVQVESYADDVNSFAETRSTIAMTGLGSGQYTAVIPGKPDRSVVRFRIKADRGSGLEVVSPRADDPAIVPSGAFNAAGLGPKEAWHGYFVTPVRSLAGGTGWASDRVYDILISDTAVTQLNTNIAQSPRRVSSPDPPGYPRMPEFNAGLTPQNVFWNGTQPAIFACNGKVYDIAMRYHGSRYRRSAGRRSYKIQFPRYALFEDLQGYYLSDKADQDNNGTQEDYKTVFGHMIFREAGIPSNYTRWVDMYLNNAGLLTRLEQTELDNHNLEKFYAELQTRYPGTPGQPAGEVYKVKGLQGDEGPYGFANGQPLQQRTAGALVPGGIWTPFHRYEWTTPIQDHTWKGYKPEKDMIDTMWTARGDQAAALANPSAAATPNLTALRAYFNANWDVDKMLTAMALREWGCPWDDIFHNFYLLRQADGKWLLLPWDFDNEYSGQSSSYSLYFGKSGDAQTNANGRGPQWIKDSFLRAFDAEYKQRLWLLNNSLLSSSNLTSLGAFSLVNWQGWAQTRIDYVNSTLGFGVFYQPAKPTNQTPANGGNAVPPASFQSSTYSHTKPTPRPHISTTWEIRPSTGTYKAPAYRSTSTTNLTSLPIPFEVLTLGQTYYWRVTYTDADGHPSVVSDETSFTYGLAVAPLSLIAIDATTQWRYFQTGAPPLDAENDDWKSTVYDDSAWPSGAALFHNESAALPEPKRTLLTLGRTAYYFRNHFTFPGDSSGATLKLKHIIDDGLVVYLNGTEVYRYQVTANPVLDTSLASAGVGDAFYVGPVVIPSSALVPGENVLAVEVHQVSAGSNDVVFGLSLDAVITNMRITEVMADNRSAVSNGGETPDWIELYNGSSVTVDLAGMSLSDDVAVPNKFVFPAGTIVPAQGYLVVWCDNNTTAPGLHAGFGLSDGGQTLALFNSAGTVRDTVTFGPQAPDFSIGRIPTSGDTWKLNVPTPGDANQEKTPLGLSSALRINEWMARPATGEDWFEISNPGTDPVALGDLWLSDSPTTPKITRIPPLSFIAGKGFTQFIADNSVAGGGHVNFTLNRVGESILLSDSAGTTVLNRVDFGAQSAGVSQGRFPDASTSTAFFSATASPGASNWLPISGVIINEALSASTTPLEDMIELRNNGASGVALGGWFLSDSASNFKKYQIPAGTNLATGNYLVFYETQFNAGANGFALDSTGGDSIYLSAADAGGNLTGYRAQVDFGAAGSGVSFGRIVNGNGEHFAALAGRTFPGANAAPAVGPVIVNEIMYHPPDLPGGVDNVADEFIELHNITLLPVALYDPANPANRWRLRDAVDFTFPAWTTIAPGGYIMVVNFNPADTARLAAFRTTYGLSPSVPVHGPWSGKLANDQEPVELVKPLPPVGGAIPWVLVDKVRYYDSAPWPTAADGSGSSLQRIDRSSYGNDPAVWTSGAATGGTNNISQPPMGDGDTDDDGLPDWWETLYGLNPGVAGDQDLDGDCDGANNGAEFAAATDPTDPTDVFKGEIIPDGAAGVIICFTAKPSMSYTVQYAASPGGPWEKLADVPAEGGSPRTIDTPDTFDASHTFYRIVTPQQP